MKIQLCITEIDCILKYIQMEMLFQIVLLILLLLTLFLNANKCSPC